MAKIVIFGTGHAAQMMKVYLEREQQSDQVVAFTVDPQFKTSLTFEGLPVIAWDKLEQVFPPTQVEILGPLTHHRLNKLRRERHEEAESRGYRLASFIHPRASVYAAEIGEGCVILDLVVVQPCCEIGKGVVIWSSSTVGHHTKIGDYCFISSQVGVGGRSNIGERCYLAGQVGITPGVTIGEASAILNAAVVKSNVPPNTVIKGLTAKPMAIPSYRIEKLL